MTHDGMAFLLRMLSCSCARVEPEWIPSGFCTNCCHRKCLTPCHLERCVLSAQPHPRRMKQVQEPCSKGVVIFADRFVMVPQFLSCLRLFMHFPYALPTTSHGRDYSSSSKVLVFKVVTAISNFLLRCWVFTSVLAQWTAVGRT